MNNPNFRSRWASLVDDLGLAPERSRHRGSAPRRETGPSRTPVASVEDRQNQPLRRCGRKPTRGQRRRRLHEVPSRQRRWKPPRGTALEAQSGRAGGRRGVAKRRLTKARRKRRDDGVAVGVAARAVSRTGRGTRREPRNRPPKSEQAPKVSLPNTSKTKPTVAEVTEGEPRSRKQEDERSRNRRRRRRGAAGDAEEEQPGKGLALPRARRRPRPATKPSQRRSRSTSEEADDHRRDDRTTEPEDEDDGDTEDVSSWEVPSWNELIAALYRPER